MQLFRVLRSAIPGVAMLLMCLVPGITFAATLSIMPSVLSVHTGETATVRVVVASTDTAINSAEANILYPSDSLEVVGVSKAASVFSIWLDEPNYSNSTGVISFSGGLPTPGYQGGNGTVISIVFKAKQPGVATLQMSGAAIRADDGMGTDVTKGSSGAVITVLAPTPAQPAVSHVQDTASQAPAAVQVKSKARSDISVVEAVATTTATTTQSRIVVTAPTFAISPEAPAENGLVTMTGMVSPGTERIEIHIVGGTTHRVIILVPEQDGSYELDTADLRRGEYTVWAEAVTQGIHSRPTQGVHVSVSSPIVATIAGADITLIEVLWTILLIALAGLALGARATYHLWKQRRLHSRLRDITNLEKEIIKHSGQLRVDLEKFAAMFEYTHRHRDLSKAEQSMYRSITALIRQLNSTTTDTEVALDRTEKEEK